MSDPRAEQKHRWYLANKEYVLEKRREYREANKSLLKEKSAQYRIKNLDTILARQKRWAVALKNEMIAAYGGKCQCPGCDENRFEFMTLDHKIPGESKKDKKKHSCSKSLYMGLKRRGWPKDNYQLLCWNCNSSKGVYGYCPHEREQLALETTDAAA